MTLSSLQGESHIGRYIRHKSVDHKVTKGVKEFIKTHEKKLKNLTKNSVLPVTSDQIRLSPIFHLLLSTLINWMFSNMDLRTRFAHPRSTKRTSCFELISQRMLKNLKENNDTSKLATELSHLAHTHVSSYRTTASDLKKHRILKEQEHCNIAAG